MGDRLVNGLLDLQAEFPFIGDVRGLGLMIATEFTPTLPEHGKQLTKAVQKMCIENKLLLLDCGPYGNVIRWIPPLIVSEAEIDKALNIFHNRILFCIKDIYICIVTHKCSDYCSKPKLQYRLSL